MAVTARPTTGRTLFSSSLTSPLHVSIAYISIMWNLVNGLSCMPRPVRDHRRRYHGNQARSCCQPVRGRFLQLLRRALLPVQRNQDVLDISWHQIQWPLQVGVPFCLTVGLRLMPTVTCSARLVEGTLMSLHRARTSRSSSADPPNLLLGLAVAHLCVMLLFSSLS